MNLLGGYSKAPVQPQSSARPICPFLTLWWARGADQWPYALLHIGARRATYYAMWVHLLLVHMIIFLFIRHFSKWCNENHIYCMIPNCLCAGPGIKPVYLDRREGSYRNHYIYKMQGSVANDISCNNNLSYRRNPGGRCPCCVWIQGPSSKPCAKLFPVSTPIRSLLPISSKKCPH